MDIYKNAVFGKVINCLFIFVCRKAGCESLTGLSQACRCSGVNKGYFYLLLGKSWPGLCWGGGSTEVSHSHPYSWAIKPIPIKLILPLRWHSTSAGHASLAPHFAHTPFSHPWNHLLLGGTAQELMHLLVTTSLMAESFYHAVFVTIPLPSEEA